MLSGPSVFLELFGSCRQGSIMSKTLVLFLLLLVHEGLSAGIIRLSSHPVRAFQGSDALFQWILNKHRPARHDFERLVFGIWRNGYITTYIVSVTKEGKVIQNPSLRDEFPSLVERVQWKGDLAKSLAVFQISHVELEDQMHYGLRLEFAALRYSYSDFLSLRVEDSEKGRSAITTTLSPPLSVAPGSNASFRCEFQVGDSDKSVYDGIAVGTWKRGGLYMTLLTLTNTKMIVLNPKLDQELPKYVGRVQAKTWSNKTRNTSTLSIEFRDVRQSDVKTYGCQMFLGAFQGSLGASLRINAEVHSEKHKRQIAEEYFVVHARVGESVRLPCNALSEVRKLDGAFKAVRWSYSSSEKCHNTKWCWMAGMNGTGIIQVDNTGPYANRMTLFSNGSLEIVNVKPSDETDYKCYVERTNHASARFRFPSLKVDSREPPKITSRSPDEKNVPEGNVLYLKCDADGMPTPTIVWRKNGLALENTTVFNKDFLLENATKADAGAYECVASNSVGSDNYTVIVTILPTEGSGSTRTPTKEVLVSPSPSPSKSFTGGEVAAIVAGVVSAIVFIMAIIFCVWKRKVRHDRQGGITKKAFKEKVPEEKILAPMGPDF